MHYYTYAYLREDKTPYYIGKGKGYRIYRKDRRIKPPKDKSRIIFLKKNLTEEEAFKHEIYMIDVLGRKDLGTGILHNRSDGGEGVSGFIHSEKTKIKMSEARKGEKNYNYGKTLHIDYLIFETGKTYSFPVFTVNTEFHSNQRETKLHPRDQPCRDAVINFWKNESSSFDLNDFFCYNKPNDHLMVRKIELNKPKFSYN